MRHRSPIKERAMSRDSKPSQAGPFVKRAAIDDGMVPTILTVPGGQTSPRIIAASALMFEDPRSKETAAQIQRRLHRRQYDDGGLVPDCPWRNAYSR
jgi:hypothetical protein